jgi:hypothetical protein
MLYLIAVCRERNKKLNTRLQTAIQKLKVEYCQLTAELDLVGLKPDLKEC